MSYKQRSNEMASIKPFGFTGVISKNSNLLIDKSYIEKGTSFVNAFENSNVILKDCGSPYPVTSITSSFVQEISNQITYEKDSIKLPPWIHYKLERDDRGERETPINSLNKFVIKLDHIRDTSDKITSYRNDILTGMVLGHNEYNGDYYTAPSGLIPEVRMYEDGVETDLISQTANGQYYLDGVQSSIRAVWPLNDVSKNNLDTPEINLHFVNRELLNLKSANGLNVLINGVAKTDKFGKAHELENESIDSISPNSHKKIVKVVANKIQYKENDVHGSGETFKIVQMNHDGTEIHLDYNDFKDKFGKVKHYIMGPYFNSKKYLTYYKNVKGKTYKELANDSENDYMNLYFKFNNTVYDLFGIINNEYSSDENYQILSSYYNVSNLLSSAAESNEGIIKLDSFSIKNERSYQPGGESEKCNFIGLKLNSSSNEGFSDNLKNKLYSFNGSNYIDVESEFFGFNKNELSDVSSYAFKNGGIKYFKIGNEDSFILNSNSAEDVQNDLFKTHAEEGNDISFNCKEVLSAQISAKKNIYNIIQNKSDSINELTLEEFYKCIDSVTIAGAQVEFDSLSAELSASVKLRKYNITNIVNTHLTGDQINENNHNSFFVSGSYNGQSVSAYLKPKISGETLYYLFKIDESVDIDVDYRINSLSSYENINNKWYCNNILKNENLLINPEYSYKFSKPYLNGFKKKVECEHSITGDDVSGSLLFSYDFLKNYSITLFDEEKENCKQSVYNSVSSKISNALYNKYRPQSSSKNILSPGYYLISFKTNGNDQSGFNWTLEGSNIYKIGLNEKITDPDYFHCLFGDYSNNNNYIQLSSVFDFESDNNTFVDTYKVAYLEKLNTISVESSNNLTDFVKIIFGKNNDVNEYPRIDAINNVTNFHASNNELYEKLYNLKEKEFKDSYYEFIEFNGIKAGSISGTLLNDQRITSVPPLTYTLSTSKEKIQNALSNKVNSSFNIGDKHDSETVITGIQYECKNPNEINVISNIISNKDNFRYALTKTLNGSLPDESDESDDLYDICSNLSSQFENQKPNNFNTSSLTDVIYELSSAELIGWENATNHDYLSSIFRELSGNIHINVEYGTDNANVGETIILYDNKELVKVNTIIKELKIKANINESLKNRKYQYDRLSNDSYIIKINNLTPSLNINDEITFEENSLEVDNIENTFYSKENLINLINSKYDSTKLFNDDNAKLWFNDGKYKNLIFNDESIDSSLTFTCNTSLDNDGNYYIGEGSNKKYLYYNEIKLSEGVLNNLNSVTLTKNSSNEYIVGLSWKNGIGLNGTEYQNPNIIFFFDKDCKIPVEIDRDYKLYDHNINGKKIYKNEQTITSVDSSTGEIIYNYKYAYEFKLEQEPVYELKNFNDWYDVDTYINYSYLNSSATNDKYKLKFNGEEPKYFDNYAVLTGKTSIEISSCISSTININTIINEKNYIENGSNYNINSLFKKEVESEKYLGYKTFSFNFMIPEDGWDKFNDEMYKLEKHELVKNLNDAFANTSNLSAFMTQTCYTFNGKFLAKYRNLKAETQTDANAVGINRYNTKTYSCEFVAIVKNTNDGTGRKIFSMSSENETLRFSEYLTKHNSNLDDDEDNSEIYESEHMLKSLLIDWERDETKQKGKIQLTNILAYIRYNETAHKLTITTSVEDELIQSNPPNGLHDKISTAGGYEYKYDVPTYGYLLNSKYLADDGFISNVCKSIFGNNPNYYGRDPQKVEQLIDKLYAEKSSKIYDYRNELSSKYGISATIESSLIVDSVDDFWYQIDLPDLNATASAVISGDERLSAGYYSEDKTCFKTGFSKALSSALNKDFKGLSTVYGSCDYDYHHNYYNHPINKNSHFDFITARIYDSCNIKGKYRLYVKKLSSYKYQQSCETIVTKGISINDIKSKSNSIKLDLMIHGMIWLNWNKNIAIMPKGTGHAINAFANAQWEKYVSLPKYVIIPLNDENEKYVFELEHKYWNLQAGLYNGQNVYDDLLYNSTKSEYVIGDWRGNICNVGKSTLEPSSNELPTNEIEFIEIMKYKGKMPIVPYNTSLSSITNSLDGNNISAPLIRLRYKLTSLKADDVEIKIRKETIKYAITKLDFPEEGIPFKEIYGNLINDVKSSDNYFITWMTPGDMLFVDASYNGNFLKEGESFNNLSCYFNVPSVSSHMLSTDVSLTGGLAMTNEQFVKPFDMSTNLFYYDGGNNEKIIINAKKMYNEVEHEDKKPDDSSFRIDYDDLYDKEIILTGELDFDGNPENHLEEEKFWVNKQYEYMMSGSTPYEGDESASSGWTEVRYTDLRPKAYQWFVYRMKDSIPFTSINDINVRVIPDSNLAGADNQNDYDTINSFDIPCKLKISFNDLLLKQKCREGIEYDNVKSIDFDRKIFKPELVSGALSTLLSSRWGLRPIPSSMVPIVDGQEISLGNNVDYRNYGYYAYYDDRIYDDNNFLGGDNYYNDVLTMNIINNSVNKWTTIKSDTKYSDLYVFCDYAPSTPNSAGFLIGTPYLNLDKIVAFNMKDETNIADSYLQKGEIAKIATDIKVVNNINSNLEIPDEEYPNVNNSIKQNFNLLVSFNDGKTELTIDNINYTVYDSEMKGMIWINISNGNCSNKQSEGHFGIYMDGHLYEKSVYINNSKTFSHGSGQNAKEYNILSIIDNSIELSADGTRLLKGSIKFQICEEGKNINDGEIEIHNVKPLCPTINKFGIACSNDYDENKRLRLGNGIWSKYITLNEQFVNYSFNKDQPFFALQSAEEIKSSVVEKIGNNGKITGIIITIKLKGLRKFKNAGFRYFIENQTPVVLSSEELLNSYKVYGNISPDGGECIDGYSVGAELGDTVISGNVKSEYNKITTVPFTESYKGEIGYCEYKYNPLGNNDFQIEMFVKNGNDLRSYLYYVNLPVDRWYNISLYKYVKNTKDYNDGKTKFGITLTDITGEDITLINSKSKEIFNVYTPNEKVLYGLNPSIDVLSQNVNSWITGGMYCYKSSNNIEFDPCSRAVYDAAYYTNNSKYLYKSSDDITDYEYTLGKNRNYLIKLSESLNDINFSQPGKIKLFANDDVYDYLKDFYYKNNNAYNKIEAGNLRNIISGYVPVSIVYNGESDKYSILRKKDTTYHIKNIENMRCGSLMWISSPNLSEQKNNNDGIKYYDMFNNALDKVNDYIDYFGNPQHKLPPISYSHRILNSNYATFVYNECVKTSGYKNIVYINKTGKSEETISYNYSNDPLTIAYVWDNSQVTRNETYKINDKKNNESKLYWVKSSNAEYTAEIGSLYNFQNISSISNTIISIETGSITQRQTTLMPNPNLSDPLSYERKMNDEVMITIDGFTDPVIATAALGFNSNGYPLNGLMVFNSNSTLSVNSKNTTYLYIAQNEDQGECRFGGTEEKPVYVDTVQKNIAANSEKFEFLPNPQISEWAASDDYDSILSQYYGGNVGSNQEHDVKYLFQYGSELNNLSCYLMSGEIRNLVEYTLDRIERENQNGLSNNHLSLSAQLNNAITSLFDQGYASIRDQTYYGTVGLFDSYSEYNYDIDEIKIMNSNSSNDVKYAMFIGNSMAFANTSEVSLLMDSFNVFYDETLFENKINENATKYWETKKCFYFDGCFVKDKNVSSNDVLNVPTSVENDSDNTIRQQMDIVLSDTNIVESEPTMGIIWLNDKNKPSNYGAFKNNITNDSIFNEEGLENGHAIFDNYFSCNLTGVKLKIKQEHLTSAPIYIKIYLLKAENSGESNVNFKWVNDPTLDIDLRNTYENEYDYSSGADKEIVHQFISLPDDLSLTKHAFGIKFVIKQIVPQNNETNSCIIDDIKVYASNILNKYGQAMAVQDVFVRKNDANCRNFYNMKVNEYVWQVPNSIAEWRTLSGILEHDSKNDKEYIDESAWSHISGIVSGLSTRNNDVDISTQLNQKGDNFSLLNTYYITNGSSTTNLITDVLSDNYLNENEDISITWKYVDYVYIYYSTTSTNSRFLLEKYFGNKIYSAVREKLNYNVENLNANSAFKDKYHFSGGIAVAKKEVIDEEINANIFDWTSSTENVMDWTEVIKTDTYDVYQEKTVTTSTVHEECWNGKVHSSYTTYNSKTTEEKTGTKSFESRSNRLDKTTFESKAVVSNPKYESAEKWVANFEPIMIKYRID